MLVNILANTTEKVNSELLSAAPVVADSGLVTGRSNQQLSNIEMSGRRGIGSRDPGLRNVRGQSLPMPVKGNARTTPPKDFSSQKVQNPRVFGTESRPSHTPSAPYKELLSVPATLKANSRSESTKSQCDDSAQKDILEQDFNAPCTFVRVGACNSCGQHAIKVIYCGKEWCSHCGQEGSPTHMDRFAKYLSRARQMNTMGYFVIEWPIKYRHIKSRVYSAAGLRATTNKVVEILAGKRMGRRGRVGGYFSRGMSRWHWFGDKNPGFNPHMNVLVDSGFIQKEKLEEIIKALKTGLKCPDLIVHYEFRTTPAKMAHTTRYVTRPTFHDRAADPYMATELFETVNDNGVVVPFRNSRTWGDWKQEQVWETSGSEVFETIDKLRNRNECPCCGKQMTWSEAINKNYLKVVERMGLLKPIVRGYYEFKPNDYKGEFRGVEVVETLDVETGELIPVDVKDVARKMILNGHSELLGKAAIIKKLLDDDIEKILRPYGIQYPSKDWLHNRIILHLAELRN